MSRILQCGAVLALILSSAGAYADDPTALLNQQRGNVAHSRHHHRGAAFSDAGPCQSGYQSEPFPNGQGYRCIR